MASTFKILGQINPAATTSTTLYTVPGSTSVVASSLVVVNTDASAATFRVSVAVAGAALNIKQYLVYDAEIAANETTALTLGITLATTDVVRVYASTALLSFNLFGEEIT